MSTDQDTTALQNAAVAATEDNGIEATDVTVDADVEIAPPLPVAAEEPAIREIILRVPAAVPDERVQAALHIGQDALEGSQRGLATLLFPTRNPQTGEPMVGRAIVPLLAQKDIDRLLKLCQAIGDANQKAAQRVQAEGPVALLAAQREAEQAKDNAARDLTARAEGRAGGIIIPGG